MMRGMGNMQGMMKQVQKMQKEMVKEQEALNSKEFIGESTFTGDKKLRDLSIDQAIVDPEDVDMLQDMLILAVNDGLTKIEKETERTMGKYTKGIPGL